MAELLDDAESFGNDQADACRNNGGVLVTHGTQKAVANDSDDALEVTDFCVIARHYFLTKLRPCVSGSGEP